METIIADKIIEAAKSYMSLGQEKYKSYFIDLDYYVDYKEAVDKYLTEKGYEECIVTE